MTSEKRLTIGVTVNLERYENLRVAVEGDVETIEDAENLARYLDDVLAGFGKNDPETEKQIAHYRFRVLPGKGDIVNDGTLSQQEERGTKSDLSAGIPVQSDAQKGVINPSDAPLPVAPVKDETSFVCADCGAPISKKENKLGYLFVDRPLCKACLETLQKAQH
ncbi:hypothetical protein L0665_09870 [Methanogenium marinum]|uniref:Uncharacterized protein n=1 Tax=Methanogenium marinum TaxID=348610 RepID=A0A9Q4KQZ2_9EURY|nr:hypothetical protein [Methanogenium marinum]MDE4908913.1 hypothetical protein [Methanogenium marinum]